MKISGFSSLVVGAALAVVSSSTHAADGCKFLLCIAGPWASISQCVPTVREVLRDLARGRPFPFCSMGGAGNGADNFWVDQASCPSMYRQYGGRDGAYIRCTYPGLINVQINGVLWSQLFWDMNGNTSIRYTDVARQSLTQQPGSLPLDDRFLNDLIGWNSLHLQQCQNSGGTAEFDAFGSFSRCRLPNDGGSGG